MRIFDFHCDTISECANKNKNLYENDLHISLKKAEYLENYLQDFAIFISDEKRGEQAENYFDKIYSEFLIQLDKNSDKISFVKCYSDIEKVFSENKTAALLSVEGGAAINGKIDRLHYIYNCGVRLMTLTWNGRDEIGDGTFTEDAGGLTPFGIDTVKEMNSLGMIIDVSHLSRKGFYDVEKYSRKPFVASHSNCNIVDNIYARHRNLDDEQVKILVERSGFVGLNFADDFLGNCGDTGKEAVLRHTCHFLELGAENILGLGCDFDGCNVNPELSGIEKMPVLYDYFNKELGKDITEKIFYKNADSFLKQNF